MEGFRRVPFVSGGYNPTITNQANAMFYPDIAQPPATSSAMLPYNPRQAGFHNQLQELNTAAASPRAEFSSYNSPGSMANFLGKTAGSFLTGGFPLASAINTVGDITTAAMRNHQANLDLEFRKDQLNRDYEAAKQMGLSHPSQMYNLQSASINKFGNRNITNIPRSANRYSPYGY